MTYSNQYVRSYRHVTDLGGKVSNYTVAHSRKEVRIYLFQERQTLHLGKKLIWHCSLALTCNCSGRNAFVIVVANIKYQLYVHIGMWCAVQTNCSKYHLSSLMANRENFCVLILLSPITFTHPQVLGGFIVTVYVIHPLFSLTYVDCNTVEKPHKICPNGIRRPAQDVQTRLRTVQECQQNLKVLFVWVNRHQNCALSGLGCAGK